MTLLFGSCAGITLAADAPAGSKQTAKNSSSKTSQSPAPQPPQTGPEAVPVLYAAKYVPDDQSCGSMLAKNLWATPRATAYQKTFDPVNLPGNTPKMNPFIAVECDKPTTTVDQRPIILHGSLWKKGATDGTWSQFASQWQVYHPAEVSKDPELRGILADGYKNATLRKPTKQTPPPNTPAYNQPATAFWPAKPPLYNDSQVGFIGVSCFYDWDGRSLEDPARIKTVTVSYKIETVSVVPDNVNNLNSILSALFPATSTAGAKAREIESQAVVPGDRIRILLSGSAPQSSAKWAISPKSDPKADPSIDDYGTLTVPPGAAEGSVYAVTATDKISGKTVLKTTVKIAGVLPCLVAQGDVDVSSLPSDINITLNVADSSQKKAQKIPDQAALSSAEPVAANRVEAPLVRASWPPPGPSAGVASDLQPDDSGDAAAEAVAQPASKTGQTTNSGCSSTGTSGCSTTHKIRDFDREAWDVGLGLSAFGVKEPQYSPSNPLQQISPKNHAGTVYGFANFFPFQAAGYKTSYYPSLLMGIPVTGKVFSQPFFGVSENILGWWKRAPLQVNLIAGMVFLNQEVVTGNSSGSLEIGHARVWKPMFGVELPVSSLASKIKSLGGSSTTKSSTGGSQ
ncbi:MAG: hypothetical protein ABSH50_09550 [Bryobacteraceae bacterium]